ERSVAGRAPQPVERADVVHTLPVGARGEPQYRIAEPEAVDDRQRTVLQQIERADEGPHATARPDPDRRRVPFELAGKKLGVQGDHLAVALEQMVVIAVDPHAVT